MTATTEQHRSTDAPRWWTSLDLGQKELYRRIPDEMEYVYHPSFSLPQAEERLFGEQAEHIPVPRWTYFPEGTDESPPQTVERTTLTREHEQTLFLRYNYARYRLSKLIEAQNRRRSGNRAQAMVLWYRRVRKCRSDLVRANMALVLAMAKRARVTNVEFTELVSEGNMALLRAINKFDVSRGYKFSTYACRAILKSFNRLGKKAGRYRQFFPVEFEPEFEKSDEAERNHERHWSDSVEAVQDILASNGARLSELERTVVTERFAIGSGGKGRTLAQIGDMVGLTNERIRQIQNAALDKIRLALTEDYLAA
ncbi:MAG: sigma-70 family RNA polymerase sigma factor [Phycisphaerae bacterium]